MLQGVRHAFRALRRAPGFSGAAILILGVGIGANTAIFSLMDAVLFRPLPAVGAPAALVTLKGESLSYPQYRTLAAEARGTTLGAAALVLAVSGLLAAYVPARRASRIDPIAAIRTE